MALLKHTRTHLPTRAQLSARTFWHTANWLRDHALLLLLTLCTTLPLGVVALHSVSPTWSIWQHLAETILPRMLLNTTLLLVGVGGGTFVLGTTLAWLIAAYTFPGRKLFDWLLLLPLAMPSYILAYVFIATFDFVGPVQTNLRGWFGKDVWFPRIDTGWSAVLVMTLVLYPYVYLMARAAFREQCATTFDAARTLGYSRTRTMLRIVLPMARPSLAAGVALALMEALTDFATVRFFNFPTLSEGVVRIWEGMMDRQAAMELASLLFFVALAVLLIERNMRGNARYYQTGGRARRFEPVTLHGWQAWLATAAASSVLLLAFALPTLQLLLWTITEFRRNGAGGTLNVTLWEYARTTVAFASVTALVAILWAMLQAHTARMHQGRFARAAVRLSTLGYAMPGAVVAVGVLLVLTRIDHSIHAWSSDWLGLGTGLLLSGSFIGLVYGYLVRFMAMSLNSVEASLEKVTPTMTAAARTMGASPWRVLYRIHMPLVATGALTGALLVFVEVMKELPITLMLRPFGTDTLAIWAYLLVSEGFWEAAAVPSLMILATGLLPVLLLMRITRSQPAH